MANPHTTRTFWLSDTLVLFVTIGFFYLLFLGSRALAIPDEQRYAEIGREMVVSGHYLIPHIDYIKYFEKPDLFYWLQALSIKLFGVNEWAARFWVAGFGLFGAIVTYLGARKLFDRTTGWLAAWLLATSPLYYCMAHITTLDMGVSFFITVSLLSFMVATTLPMGKSRRGIIYLSALSAALAVLTKGLIGIVFPLMIVGTWILLRRDWRLVKQIYLPSALLLFFIVALPWHLLMMQTDPNWFHFYFIEQQVLRYSTDYAQRYQPIWFFIPVLLIGFFPWVIFLPHALLNAWRNQSTALYPAQRRACTENTQRASHFFLFLWGALIFIFFSLSQSKLIGYILPIFPALAIIVAVYLRGLLASLAKKSIRYHWLSITLLNIAFAIGLPIALYLAPMANKPSFLLWSLLLSLLIASTTLISLYLCDKKGLRSALVLLILGMATALPLANVMAGYFDDRSIKPMAMTIKPLLTNKTEVISFRHYYQDLPFYLQQRVIIADWQGELSFGLHHQSNTGAWIWNDQAFLKNWHRDLSQRFAIMRRDEYQKLKREHPLLPLYPIRYNRRDVLVSNRRMSS